MIRIAPSLLAADFSCLGDEIKKVEDAGANCLHLDVMDGHFVPNITIGPLIVKAVKRAASRPLDVHLMITEPDRYLEEFAGAGADIITVHVEACVHLHSTVQMIRKLGSRPGVVLNPHTPASSIEEILPDCDMVVAMTVNPGFGGQKFIPNVLPKIRRIREMIDAGRLACELEVDGGVTVENIGEISEAGADVFVSGSGVFGSGDYEATIKKMKEIAGK